MIQTMSLQNKTEFALIVVVKHTTVNQSGILVVTLRLFAKHAKTSLVTNLVKDCKMNKQKVINAIKVIRRSKEDTAVQYVVEDAQSLLEALEEIASDVNIEALRSVATGYSLCSEGHSRIEKLLAALVSIQVPKEIVYAYPVTMGRHYTHFANEWLSKAPPTHLVYFPETLNDDFGCNWKQFTGPKELVDYLRENNVPIKVIE